METIPKKIHLCWLSGDDYPETIGRCIASWQKIMPDYEIVLWDEARFRREIDNRFALEAFGKKKWAFAADYVRLFALANYGGIYLDSDVRVYKRFDDFLATGFFSCIEYFKPTDYVAIESAVMGARLRHPFVLQCLALYDHIPFVREDGSLDQTTITKKMAEVAVHDWGFVLEPREQHLRDDVAIYAPVVFTNPSGEFSISKTYALHLCNGSWLDKKKERFGRRIVGFIKNYWNHPLRAIESVYKKVRSKILR